MLAQRSFFIATSTLGWKRWQSDVAGASAIRRTSPRTLGWMALFGIVIALGYAWLLYRFTNAYAPWIDSSVLTFSVIAQLLLMQRRIETWWFWLLVNTIAVPLFFSRGLNLTAILYIAFWFNAVISLRHWRRLMLV